jgi:hypothetical protein
LFSTFSSNLVASSHFRPTGIQYGISAHFPAT